MRALVGVAAVVWACSGTHAADLGLNARIVNDGIPMALSGSPGDAARGRAIVASRQQGMCLLCHNGPAALFPEEQTPGTVAASLAGAGARWTEAQLRLRVADARRLNPQSVMPSYLRSEGLQRVAASRQGQTLLSPQQVDDVVAFLVTLQ
jgi:L-cysteine S-thiosulfotransferase